MANQLLSISGLDARAAAPPPTKAEPTMTEKTEKKARYDENSRCFRFSSDVPKGRIFVGAEAIAAAEKDGWKDSPAKLKAGGGKGKAGNAGK